MNINNNFSNVEIITHRNHLLEYFYNDSRKFDIFQIYTGINMYFSNLYAISIFHHKLNILFKRVSGNNFFRP